jgi:thiamine biosynthesis protein ThiI
MPFKENETLVIAHFGELWLKGHNRNEYIARLMRNVAEQLSGESCSVQRNYDRIIIRLTGDSDLGSIRAKVGRTFGLSGYEVATVAEPKVAKISALARKMLRSRKGAKSVRINSHRSDKTLPFDSVEIIRRVRKAAEGLGIVPDTRQFDTELNISVTGEAAFLSLDRSRGPGGLPVGSSGKGVVLMSGGIDSPVAAWYAMKRGVSPVYVHLHAFQDPGEALNGKVADILATLSGFYPHYKAYFVPAHIFQAGSFRYGRYELILLKAFMLRLAERVANRERACSVFTGESLGQVASQTPANLLASQSGTRIPVLRPLIGFDKEEIIRVARAIGTYEDSIRQYRDVCSINARNPTLSADPAATRRMLREMNIGGIVTRSLKAARIVTL